MIDDAEALARQRFMVMNLARIAGLALVLGGIAIAQGAIELPAPLGWVIAIGGMLGFFFAPRLLARSWKSDDQ